MKLKSIVLIGCLLAFVGCDNDDDDNPQADTSNNFSTISRDAFAKPANGIPTVLNDRAIVYDVTDPAAYNDLLGSGSQ